MFQGECGQMKSISSLGKISFQGIYDQYQILKYF